MSKYLSIGGETSPSSGYLKKRERTQNWSMEEKEQLLDLCSKDIHIIENKRCDANHTEAKTKVWQQIHQSFSIQHGSERSVNRLKEQWRRMKATARAEILEYKNRGNLNSPERNIVKKPTKLSLRLCQLLEEAHRTHDLELSSISTDINSLDLDSVNSKELEDSTVKNTVREPQENVNNFEDTQYADVEKKIAEEEVSNTEEIKIYKKEKKDTEDSAEIVEKKNIMTLDKIGRKKNFLHAYSSDSAIGDAESDEEIKPKRFKFSKNLLKEYADLTIHDMRVTEHLLKIEFLQTEIKCSVALKQLLDNIRVRKIDINNNMCISE